MNKGNPFAKRLRFGSKLGLERITALCQVLGHPQRAYRSIHVGGTNGKGSTASFVASVLQHNGYKVGLFTSPHLVDYRERFQVNGQLISAADLRKHSLTVSRGLAEMERAYPQYGTGTEFEAATALAFTYFAAQHVDYAIFEVGLGGRLDSTNVIIPEVSIITPIGHDHLERLGPTICDVAGEKAGIIKEGVPVISGIQVPQVETVLKKAASACTAEYHGLNAGHWQPHSYDLSGGQFWFPYFSQDRFTIGLVGKHQLENAATALLALAVLHGAGLDLNELGIRRGLAAAKWPGRLEVVSQKPLMLFDGAHNQEAIQALALSLRDLVPGEHKITFVIGLSADKNINLLAPLFPLAKRIVFTEARNSRLGPMPASVLSKYAQAQGINSEAVGLDEVFTKVAGEDLVCFCGSLYLLGDVKSQLDQVNKG